MQALFTCNQNYFLQLRRQFFSYTIILSLDDHIESDSLSVFRVFSFSAPVSCAK